MTIVIQSRILSYRPTSSISFLRKASHGPNRFLSVMIKEFVLTVFSSVNLYLRDQVSRFRSCRRWLAWSAPSISCLAKTKFIEPNTNLTESSAPIDNFKKVKHPLERLGCIKMPCNVNHIHALSSWYVKEIQLNFHSLYQTWMALLNGSSGSP